MPDAEVYEHVGISLLLPELSTLVMFYLLLLAPVLVSYLVLVRTLRYRRVEQIQKQHGSTPAEFENLNYRDAQTIIGQLVCTQYLGFRCCI
jgi:hypothetical protein